MITEIPGIVQVLDSKKKREVVVTDDNAPEGSKERQKTYQIKYGSRLRVFDGQMIEAGTPLTDGSINPHDIMKIRGVRAVQDYMLCEVQKVYRLQGVDINDKHIEVIVRQMLRKVRIEKSGDTDFLPGSLVDFLDFEDMNESLIKEGKEPAEGTRIVLGITKSALATNSFLSAASFQETTKVLTDAAIKGKVDPLVGLKENVIIGQLIPAGTGLKRYRNIHLDTDVRIREREEAEAEELELQDESEETSEEIREKDEMITDNGKDEMLPEDEAGFEEDFEAEEEEFEEELEEQLEDKSEEGQPEAEHKAEAVTASSDDE